LFSKYLKELLYLDLKKTFLLYKKLFRGEEFQQLNQQLNKFPEFKLQLLQLIIKDYRENN